MKISEVIKDLPNHKRIIVMQKVRTGYFEWEWENKIIANCTKGALGTIMVNYDQATVHHYYENEAFDALVIKVENYWLQKVIEEREYGKSALSGEKIYKSISGYQKTGMTTVGLSMPTIYYTEESE